MDKIDRVPSRKAKSIYCFYCIQVGTIHISTLFGIGTVVQSNDKQKHVVN